MKAKKLPVFFSWLNRARFPFAFVFTFTRIELKWKKTNKEKRDKFYWWWWRRARSVVSDDAIGGEEEEEEECESSALLFNSSKIVLLLLIYIKVNRSSLEAVIVSLFFSRKRDTLTLFSSLFFPLASLFRIHHAGENSMKVVDTTKNRHNIINSKWSQSRTVQCNVDT